MLLGRYLLTWSRSLATKILSPQRLVAPNHTKPSALDKLTPPRVPQVFDSSSPGKFSGEGNPRPRNRVGCCVSFSFGVFSLSWSYRQN